MGSFATCPGASKQAFWHFRRSACSEMLPGVPLVGVVQRLIPAGAENMLHVSVACVWTLCLCDVDHACSVVFFTSLCVVVDVVPAEPFAGGLCGFSGGCGDF